MRTSTGTFAIPVLAFSIALIMGSCGANPGRVAGANEVAMMLDSWHGAAASADTEGYLGRMIDDGVFMGTDPQERWTTAEFRQFVQPYFSRGQGWTYVPKDRHVSVSADGTVAWFDERLLSEKYGELRGTGVAMRVGGVWKIAHYSMTFPLPNPLTVKIVEMIRGSNEE